MTLIKSHTFTINLANVNYIKSSVDIDNNHGTLFYMNNGKCVTITCPYDVVIHQLAGQMNIQGGIEKTIVRLEY